MGPVVEQIVTIPRALQVVKVNIDEEPTLAQRYDVQSIPLDRVVPERSARAQGWRKPRPQLEAELGMLVIP